MTRATDTLDEGNMEDMGEHARAAADLLKALAHETRLMILCLLFEGEKSVSELEQLMLLRQPSVSQQLARLRFDGLVWPHHLLYPGFGRSQTGRRPHPFPLLRREKLN